MIVQRHTHTFPVDASMTPDEAWDELCLMGVRATNTGSEAWSAGASLTTRAGGELVVCPCPGVVAEGEDPVALAPLAVRSLVVTASPA